MDTSNRNIHRRIEFKLLIAVLVMVHLIKIITEGARPVDYVLIVLELLIVMIMAGEIIVTFSIWCKKRRQLAGTFGLRLRTDYFTQPIQATRIMLPVEVIINHPTEIRTFSFRFSAKSKGVNVSQRIALIDDIRHEEIGLLKFSDGRGGYTAEFIRPPFRGSGNSLFFQLTIEAFATWSGYLTFESYDSEHNLRCVSQPINFTEQRPTDFSLRTDHPSL